MKACVYTALFGKYESLNEQAIARNSGIPFICFTDDPDLKSETWQLRLVSPIFTMDTVRSQREYKLQPHRFLSEYDSSIYIDNSVVLTARPEDILERYFPTSGFCIFEHSYRESVLDEFLEVARLGFDDQARIFEQLNHYSIDFPEILNEKPYWGGIQLRSHGNEVVRKMLDIWYAHVLRYSRRDQLSVNLAFKLANLTPDVISDSNNSSWFHTWRNFTNRNKGATNPYTSLTPLLGRLRQLELEISDKDQVVADKDQVIADKDQVIADMDQVIAGLLNTFSWKITAPGRKLISLISGNGKNASQ